MKRGSMRVIGYLRAAALLILAMAAWGFARSESYTYLMNPAFRWVTMGGAILVFLMAAALFWRPDRGWSAALVFALFYAMVAFADPQAGGVTPMLVPPSADPVEREGYPPFASLDLFENLDTEAEELAEGKVAMRGFAKRLPELDAQGRFILLEPVMACCLADALALGLRVQATPETLPTEFEWIHVFGELKKLPEPEPVPSFRVGAILLTSVSRTHTLVADEIVRHQDLLGSFREVLPADRCALLVRAMEASGIEEELEGEERYTLFAPLDSAFGDLTPAAREALVTDPEAARALLRDHLVRGEIPKVDLFRNASLETLSGKRIEVQSAHGRLRVGEARVLFGDQLTRDGLIHFINVRLSSE